MSEVGVNVASVSEVVGSLTYAACIANVGDLAEQTCHKPCRPHHPRSVPPRGLRQTGVRITARKNRIGLVGGSIQPETDDHIRMALASKQWLHKIAPVELHISRYARVHIKICPSWYLKYSSDTITVFNTQFVLWCSTRIYTFTYTPHIL